MREDVLRGLAARASSDRAFLSDLRRDPEAALAAHGYALTEEESATVLDPRRRAQEPHWKPARQAAVSRRIGRGAGEAVIPRARAAPGSMMPGRKRALGR
ncbi:MAG: hypothetical protein H0X57_02735 [Rubrobacter sp.]|nr:hypothetical protein [Rubrobacter sp.]